MICKCDTEMEVLVDDFDGRENKIGTYYWCGVCGRIYFMHEECYRTRGVKDFWMEPLEVLETT